MPKLNPAGIAIATVAFFLLGYLWYGFLFAEAWMAAEGLTEEDAGDPVWMVPGLVITAMQVIGLAIVLKWKGAEGMSDAVKTAVILWAFFALPFSAYAYIYTPAHNLTLLMIDAGHLLVGWVAAAAILARYK
ncbi:MAG TPA: DUF1761 domain-containing protein [Parvularculaceae bacterium]|nr:DUF1761 domain-containing protein [Parvularculaceae bacterium]